MIDHQGRRCGGTLPLCQRNLTTLRAGNGATEDLCTLTDSPSTDHEKDELPGGF